MYKMVRMKEEFCPKLRRALPHSVSTEDLGRIALKLLGPAGILLIYIHTFKYPKALHRDSLSFLDQRPPRQEACVRLNLKPSLSKSEA